MARQLSVKETILSSVKSVLDYPWYFIKLFLSWIGFSILVIMPIYIMILAAATFGNAFLERVGVLGFIGVGIGVLTLYALALVYLWTGPIKLLLNFYDTKVPAVFFREFFHLFSVGHVFKILGLLLLYGLMVTLGLILFVIPGIYLAVKLQLALYYAIDTDTGIIDCFKKSYAATTGNFWRILAVDVIAALLFQLIITIPVSYLMGIYVYRKLG